MKYFFSIILVLFFVSALNIFSQGSTSASISGKITDDNSNDVFGAVIKVVHLPSGTKYGAKSNSKGRYNIFGLKVGGPYKLTVSMVGFEENVLDSFKLALSQEMTYNVQLKVKGYETEEVVVVANKSEIMNANKTGSAQNVTSTDISNLPSIDRSLQDYARLSPAIVTSSDGSSVAGRNNRYNSIQVDGAIMNDAFGLSGSGTPGGQTEAQPISIDAIEEIQVSVSPYDVRQGSFSGGSINAVTRSGSNYIKGSFYTYGKNQSLVGNNVLKNQYGENAPYPDFTDYIFGGRIGGPIIKDKLFYFVSAEYKKRNDPQTLQPSSTAEQNVFYVSPGNWSNFTTLRDTVLEKYGYDIGGYGDYAKVIGDYKIFARFDWNLNDFNKLTFRHNLVNSFADRGVNRYETSFTLESQEFTIRSVQNQSVLQLNSVLSDNMANELRFSYTTVRDKRDYQSDPFPQITIGNLDGDGRNSLSFGVDRSSQANFLNQDIMELTNNFSWFFDNHVLTIGTQNQIVNFENLFIQDYMGSWTFDNLDYFLKGNFYRFSFSYSLDSNNDMPTSNFSYLQYGAYLQDVFSVNENLKLTFGLRFDGFTFFDNPAENPKFAEDFPGRNTSKLPSPLAFSPRVGFNWDFNGDKELMLRGGIGIFSGTSPGVWISNQFTNSGMMLGKVDIYGSSGLDFDPYYWRNTDNSTRTTISEIAITDANFQMPSVFRTNLAVDYHLGYGFIGTFELLYGKNINDIFYRNINLQYKTESDEEGNEIISRSKDGRPIYNGKNYTSENFMNVIEMTNTDKGYQYTMTAQIQKPFYQGILPDMSFNMSYTYMDIKDINSSTVSVALSNWQNNPSIDPNDPDLFTSNFNIDHVIRASIGYSFSWNDIFKTTMSLYYEARAGVPFSFTYYTDTKSKYLEKFSYSDANNDSYRYNDLAYIPNKLSAENNWSDENMVLMNGGVLDSIYNKTYGELFEEFISQFDGIERGKIADRNKFRQPWRQSLDLKIIQAINITNHNKLEFTLDIMNVLNLLNSEWGHSESVPYNTYSLLEFDGYETLNDVSTKIKASFKPNAKGNSKDDIWQTHDFYSRWRMQLGLRFYF